VFLSRRVGILIVEKGLSKSTKELLEAARFINDGQNEVIVIAPKSKKIQTIIDEYRLMFCRIKRRHLGSDFKASLKFAQLIKEEKVSTIIYRDTNSTSILVKTKFLLKGRLRLVLIQDKHLADIGKDILSSFGYNQIDAWVTPINQTASGVKMLTNLPMERIHILNMPVPRKPFLLEEDQKELRKSVLFNDSTNLVVGWAVPIQRQLFQRTARKILRLLQNNQNVKVCLNLTHHSDDQFYAEIPEMLAFKERIRTTSFDTHDADMYAHLDFLFVDSELEPFAGIITRAIISGVIPSAPKSLVSNELLKNGELGILYSERDSKLIDEKISSVAYLTSHRLSLEEYVGTQFSKKRFKENFEALLKSLPGKV